MRTIDRDNYKPNNDQFKQWYYKELLNNSDTQKL